MNIYQRRDGLYVAHCPVCNITHHHVAASALPELQRRHAHAVPYRGLGDVVAHATTAVGIKPCQPCKQRQAALNRWWPFR